MEQIGRPEKESIQLMTTKLIEIDRHKKGQIQLKKSEKRENQPN